MKIFLIHDCMCYSDVTRTCPTLEDTKNKYSPDLLFVEAPDYVFEGWGYDKTKEGDARFIKPMAPDGWYYDDETGKFEQYNADPSITLKDHAEVEKEPDQTVLDDMTAAYEEGVNEA